MAYAVLLHHLAEGAAIRPSQVRGARDVAVGQAQESLNVVTLERTDRFSLGDLKLQRALVLSGCQFPVVRRHGRHQRPGY